MSALAVPARDAEPASHRQVLEALSGLLLVLFVALLSSTVVSTALPQIIGALRGSQTQYTWVVTATLLTATATTPVWGKLADLFNKKLLIQVAIVIFVAGSAIAGLSHNAAELIAARAFQGVGVGGLQALVQVAIAAMIPPRERGRYNGYLGGVMALATVGGPLLGGLIVDTPWLGWRWCFFVGVPVAVVALVLLQATLHLPTIKRDNVKIDYLGASLIAAGVSLLLIWVSFVDSSFAWLSWPTYAMVGGSVLLLHSPCGRSRGRPSRSCRCRSCGNGPRRWRSWPASRSAWPCSAARCSSGSTSRSAGVTRPPRPACSRSR